MKKPFTRPGAAANRWPGMCRRVSGSGLRRWALFALICAQMLGAVSEMSMREMSPPPVHKPCEIVLASWNSQKLRELREVRSNSILLVVLYRTMKSFD